VAGFCGWKIVEKKNKCFFVCMSVSMPSRFATDSNEAMTFLSVGSGWHSRGLHSIIPRKKFSFNSPAFEAGTGSGTNKFAKPIEISFDFTSFHFNLIAILNGIAEFHVESLRNAGKSPGSCGILVAMISRMPSEVVRHLTDRTFVTWTTESSDTLFQTTANGWWTGLLETDDVTAETETEIAMIIKGNLLGRDVNFAVKKTSAWSDFRFFYVGRS
jgi:hypothetical protein